MDQRNNYHVNDIKDAYNLIQRNVQHETLMTKMAAEVSTPANYVMWSIMAVIINTRFSAAMIYLTENWTLVYWLNKY